MSKNEDREFPPAQAYEHKSAGNIEFSASFKLHEAERVLIDAIHRNACDAPSAKVIMLSREMCRAEGNDPNDLVLPFVLPSTRNRAGSVGHSIVRLGHLIPSWCLYVHLADAAIAALEKAREEEMRGGPETDRDLAAMMDALQAMFAFAPDRRGDAKVLSPTIIAAHWHLGGKPLSRAGRQSMIAEVFSKILEAADGSAFIVWAERPTLVIDGDTARLSCRLDFGP